MMVEEKGGRYGGMGKDASHDWHRRPRMKRSVSDGSGKGP